jgi:hypothetical protein
MAICSRGTALIGNLEVLPTDAAFTDRMPTGREPNFGEEKN